MEIKRKIFVLRYGHRPGRDKRITTHVLLVARAFGANGFILSDVVDEAIFRAYQKVISTWGGNLYFEMGVDPEKYCLNWKKSGIIVHLTMYGLPVDKVINEIRGSEKDMLIVVGAKKVPRFFYEIADYNVAIGNQPHSEVAALALFLDRLFEGRELYLKFDNAKLEVIPSARGKHVKRLA